MTSKQKPFVLAVGAAGPHAGLVLPELKKREVRVRGLVRDSKKEAEVKQKGASEVVVGDLSDKASIAKALEGIEAVFYIAPIGLKDEAEVGKAFVRAAKEAGVRRFVFSSLIHPVISAMHHHIAKVPVEEAIVSSGLEFTILHPAMFFQNYARGWSKVVESGVLAEPYSPDTRFSRVDYRDVAEVAAIALTEDRLLDGTFELCADGTHNRKQVAGLLGEVLGKPVRAEKIDVPSTPEMAPLKPMFAWYDSHGLRGNALTLRAILGREPRTLRAYFEELSKTK